MKWAIDYIPEARKDIKNLDNSQWLVMRRAIEKVRQNPLPDYEGGYGKPLGNKRNINLSGCLKKRFILTQSKSFTNEMSKRIAEQSNRIFCEPLGKAKIKLKSSGLRAVYRLIRTESTMQMIVIGLRHDEEVYQIAEKRLQKMP